MNISAAETEPVVGADRDGFIRQLLHGCDHRLDGRAARVSFWDDSDGEIVILRPVRRIKAEPVDPETASEKQQKKNKQNRKNGHEITPEKQKRWLAGKRIAQIARFFKACRFESAGVFRSVSQYRQSMALSSEDTAVMSRVRELSVTAVLARTIFPASTEWVSQTLPPMTQSLPICVLPPRMVAPE